MIRILGFFALGGAVTLLILSSSGSRVFDRWGMVFVISAVLLLAFSWILRMLLNSRRTQREIEQAKQSGRLRRALILERRQTGLFVNEQPQIEFTLLVDSPQNGPFLTKARRIVSLLDMHEIMPGTVLTVVHPDPAYGDVHIVAEPAPQTSLALNPEMAKNARTLPPRKGGVRVSSVLGVVAAFLVGAVGAPFLATPNALAYAQLMVEGRTDEVHTLDHPVLFDPDELQVTLDRLIDEFGHDEVYSVSVHEVRLTAVVPDGSGGAEDVMMQDHAVQERGAALIPPQEETQTFKISDVAWDAVLAAVPEAQKLVADQGYADTELLQILVESDWSALERVHVRLMFDNGAEGVMLDADGNLLPSATFDQMPEAERETYLYDGTEMEAALRESLEVAEAEDMLRIVSYGDRLLMEVYATDAEGIGREYRIDYRNMYVRDVTEGDPVKPAPDELFRINDVDWSAVMQAIPHGQEAMSAGGVQGTQPTHIIIEPDNFPLNEPYELIARIYLRNAYNEGGYVVVNPQGEITRVQGP